MPARVAILWQAALTSRCSADKNRALFAAGGELRRVGTAVPESSVESHVLLIGLRDTKGLDE
jgi:hypothetical protein